MQRLRTSVFILSIFLCLSSFLPRVARGQELPQQVYPKPVLVRLELPAQQANTEDCLPGTGSIRPIGPIPKTQFETENHEPGHKLFITLLYLATQACVPIDPYDDALALLLSNNDVILPTIVNGSPTIQKGGLANSILDYQLTDLPDFAAINALVGANGTIPAITSGHKKLLTVMQFTPSREPSNMLTQEVPMAPEDFLEATGEKEWSQKMKEIEAQNKLSKLETFLRPNDFLYRQPYSSFDRTSAALLCPHLSPVVFPITLETLFPFPSLTSTGFVTKWWWSIRFSQSHIDQCPPLNNIFFISDIETWIAIGVEKQNEISESIQLDNMFKATLWGMEPNGSLVQGDAAFTYVQFGTVIVFIMVVIYAAIATPAYYLMAFTVE